MYLVCFDKFCPFIISQCKEIEKLNTYVKFFFIQLEHVPCFKSSVGKNMNIFNKNECLYKFKTHRLFDNVPSFTLSC